MKCVKGLIRLLMGCFNQMKMEVWGCSEKTPSFALVCGCCWRFLAEQLRIYWMAGLSASEGLAPKAKKKTGYESQRVFLPAGKSSPRRSERLTGEMKASGQMPVRVSSADTGDQS